MTGWAVGGIPTARTRSIGSVEELRNMKNHYYGNKRQSELLYATGVEFYVTSTQRLPFDRLTPFVAT
jgi:hypothetical protein